MPFDAAGDDAGSINAGCHRQGQWNNRMALRNRSSVILLEEFQQAVISADDRNIDDPLW
jgi:hypothetical protein